MADITDEMLYGKGITHLNELHKQFTDELVVIEEYHKISLVKHVASGIRGNQIWFRFTDRPLAEDIKQECLAAFKTIIPAENRQERP